MKKIKTIIALMVAFAALGVFADDSAPFFLNTAKGTRIAKKTELISYSTEWDKGTSVRVTADGTTLKEAVAPASGDVVWDGAKASLGLHTLTHVSGGKTLTAQFTVLGDDVAVHSGVLKSSEIWDTNKVHLVTSAITVPSGVSLTINSGAVVKFMPGMSLTVVSGGSCTASGAIFTHVNDDTIGGDTLMDEDSVEPKMGEYTITGNVIDNDATEYRYSPPQTLTSNISSDTRLRGYRTYIVSNSVTVASGATLTLQPGTVLKFNSGCSLTVNGTLDAKGTRAAPIIFTSLKDDEHGGDTNGDGDKTYAQGGDWNYIYVIGTANLKYCKAMYGAPSNETGIIETSGSGSLDMDCCVVAHARYDGIWNWGGTISVKNTVIFDTGWATAPYRGSRNEYINCIFYGNNVGVCYWSHWSGNPVYRNCIFSECGNGWCELNSGSYGDPPSSVGVYNCLFWNPVSFGAQSCGLVGKNGNIWGNPLFVDPDNGDFRISAGSPCVDAGNGDFAPETDYYGQPRMDVKNVTDTGIANAERICPDIGIYEVPGMVAVPVPDLAVMSVSAPAEAVSGESITVTYVVTNRGKAILTGTIRDIVRFRGVDAALGGQVVAAEAVSQTYSLSVGGACAEVSATVNVPALKPGNWVVSVMVNAERDIYEGISANNTADALGETRISSLSFEAGGIQTVSVASHSTAVTAVNGLSAAGGAIVAMLPAGVSFCAAVGYVPSIGQSDVIGTALADGRTALFLPPHQADELVYVTLVNESGEKVDIQLEALISSEGLEVSKPSDVEITEKGPNVIASLILPSSIRDGRIYAAYVEYSNTGDKDADMPIFTVKRTSGNAKFSASSKGAFSAETLNLVGLAPSAPRGKLKPGESGRITFYILTSGTLGVSLDMVTEKSTSVLNGFESISDYCAGMSAAATRLCARDGVEPGFTEILAQALNEKRGAGGAAVSGTLHHLITRMPLSDYMIALTATNDNSIVSAVKTDKNGAFSLSTSESGDYAITIIGVQNYETPIYSLTDTDVNGETIYAVPYSSLSGMAYIDGSLEPAARVKVTLDNVATEKIEDYVVETLDDGRYVFNGIVDGNYILSAYPVQSWCMVTSTVFTVTNGVSYSKNICYTEKGIKVTGTVTDIDTGLSVTNVLVALTLEDGSDPIGATSDGDGNFEIEGLPAGKYTLAVASDRYVLDGLPTVDISGESDITLPVSVRTKPVFSVMRPVGMVSHTTAFALLGSVSSPEWDFDGDGIVDSRELQPTYTYTVAGKYDVKLSYVDDNGVRRTCIAADGVEVLDKFENKLTSNGVVLTAGCGVTVENVSTNSLVLVGSIAGNYKVGTVIGMESGTHGGFIRKIISIRSVSGNRYEFEVEPASLDDLFDEYFYSTDFSFTEAQVAYALRASMAKVMTKSATAPTGNRHDIDIGVTIDKFDPVTITIGGEGMSLTHYSDPVAGSQICYKRNGKKVEVHSVKNSYVAKIPISVAVELASREKKLKKAKRLFNWNGCANGPAFWGPWGLYFSIDCDYGIEGSVTAEGSISGEFSLTALSVNEIRREDDKKETNKVIDRSFSDAGFSIKSLSGTLSAEADAYVIVGVYASWLKVIGRIGGGVKVGMTFGVEQDLAYDFGENILDGEFSSTFRLTSSLYGTIAGSASLLRVRDAKKLVGEIPWRLEWQGNAELGKIGFTTSGDDLTVNFGCKNPEMEADGFLLGWLDGFEIGTTGQVWSFGDMSFGAGANATHRYAQEGEYTVRMGAVCAFPLGFLSFSPFAKTTSAKVRVYDDRPPEPQEPTDQGRQNPKQSWDPNEINGPEGVGEQRFIKPGDWMTYTVYFENKAEADVPAQEVYVTNPLSPYLDWSTFEMMDVAFGNQVESGLTGKKNGTITVVQNGTEDQVQINVAFDQIKGEAKWYLRSWSPNRLDYNYWPEDGAGFLPPNDETHRGEGHITYRIKLRDDVPLGTKIDNSATIVFDYNEPIETDPAWWNIVGENIADDSLEVSLAMKNGELNEDGNYIYDGTPKCPEVSLKLKVGTETKTLVQGSDFECTFFDNINANSETNLPRVAINATGNYFGSVVTNFVIAPRPVSLVSATDTWVYDGKPHNNDTVTADGFVGSDGVVCSNFVSIVDVGSISNRFDYALKSGVIPSNYNLKPIYGTLTVTPANIADMTDESKWSIRLDGDNAKYDGTEKTVTVTALSYDGVAIPNYTISGNKATDAGSYTLTITANGNFAGAKTAKWSIGKRAVTLTSASDSKVYNGTALKGESVTVGGDGFANGEGATYTFTGSQTNVGTIENGFTYALNSNTKADNYDITTANGTLTVTTSAATDGSKWAVTLEGDTAKYDGTEKTVTVSALSYDGFAITNYTVTGNKATDAGTYTLTITATGNFTGTKTADWSIAKRSVTLTSASDSKVYDGTALKAESVTVGGDGFANGEGATYTFTGSQTDVGTSENGFTYILNGNTKASNYDVTTANGILTVTAPPTVELKIDLSKTVKGKGEWGNVRLLTNSIPLKVAVAGTITSYTINVGANVDLTFVPNKGFRIYGTQAGNGAFTSITNYTFVAMTNCTYSATFQPAPKTSLAWKYAKNKNGWFCAQISLMGYAGYSEAFENPRFLFADRVNSQNVRTSYLVDTSTVIDPLGTTEVYGNTTYRKVALPVSAFNGKVNGAKVVFGVSDATMASSVDSVPAAERTIALRVVNRNINSVELLDNVIGYFAWDCCGATYYQPLGGKQSPGVILRKPLSIRTLNNASAFGIDASAVAPEYVNCRFTSFNIANGKFIGTFEVVAESDEGTKAAVKEISSSVDTLLLGSESPAGPFEPIGDEVKDITFDVDNAPFTFQGTLPKKYKFFRLNLNIEELYK